LVVLKIEPAVPTAQPVVVLTKNTSWSVAVVGETRLVQLAPLLVVLRIVPAVPTLHPVVASTKKTEYRVAVVGNREVHEVPPLMVRRIVPVPTAQPFDVPTNWTALRIAVEEDMRPVQLEPAFVVFRMVPPVPTTHPVLSSAKWMPLRKATVGVDVDQFAPASVDLRMVPLLAMAHPAAPAGTAKPAAVASERSARRQVRGRRCMADLLLHGWKTRGGVIMESRERGRRLSRRAASLRGRWPFAL
jgi:hypothetical protein